MLQMSNTFWIKPNIWNKMLSTVFILYQRVKVCRSTGWKLNSYIHQEQLNWKYPLTHQSKHMLNYQINLNFIGSSHLRNWLLLNTYLILWFTNISIHIVWCFNYLFYEKQFCKSTRFVSLKFKLEYIMMT